MKVALMKKKVPLIYFVFFMSIILTLGACVPKIPHLLGQNNDCISCHSLKGKKPFPEWHAKKNIENNACLKCHSTK